MVCNYAYCHNFHGFVSTDEKMGRYGRDEQSYSTDTKYVIIHPCSNLSLITPPPPHSDAYMRCWSASLLFFYIWIPCFHHACICWNVRGFFCFQKWRNKTSLPRIHSLNSNMMFDIPYNRSDNQFIMQMAVGSHISQTCMSITVTS